MAPLVFRGVYAHYIPPMRRLRLYRLLALPLCFWFVAYSTDVGGLDACPMHDAPGGVMAGPMGGMAGMAMGAMTMPAASRADTAPADAPAPPPHGPAHCTCMGACCGCATATLPAPAVSVPLVAALCASVAGAPRAHAAPVVAPRFLLPPANGPPALHIV